MIEDDLVVDEQGVVVEGVHFWVGDREKEVCGVKIVACSEVAPGSHPRNIFEGASGKVARVDAVGEWPSARSLT